LKQLSIVLALVFTTSLIEAATAKHKIKNGETLYTIAKKHHTTVEEVRKKNGLKKGDILKLGRVLTVPTNTYFPNKKKKKVVKKKVQTTKKLSSYSIQSGDTLFTIARKHGMTVAELVKVNDVPYNSTLKLGQKLKVTKKAVVKKKTRVAKPKKVRKVKIVKNVQKKKKNKVLKKVIKKHAKPLASKRVKRKKTVTVDDIFFRASQPNIMFFNSSDSRKAKNIIKLAKTKLGRRYVWGATGKRGTFDCSGLTQYVFKKNGINIPRTSIKQSKFGKFVPRSKLKKGDLVFFDTSKRRKGYVNHVGIYLGNGKFIHASSAKKKVVVSTLSRFYAQRYLGARRPS
jgi:cell wall-associated NlpC family hydrolase